MGVPAVLCQSYVPKSNTQSTLRRSAGGHSPQGESFECRAFAIHSPCYPVCDCDIVPPQRPPPTSSTLSSGPAMSECDHHNPDHVLSRRDLLLAAGGIGVTVGAASLVAHELHNLGQPYEQVAPAAAEYLVMLVIDAGRADYLQYGHLPNLAALQARGATFPHAWVGQMESITPASHATIGTGVFPRHDGGLLGFWYEDAQTHTNYTCAPLDASDPARIERLIAASGVPTLSGLIKQHDPAARIFTTSGQKFYAADAAGGPLADYISYFTVGTSNAWVPISVRGHDLPANIQANPRFRLPNYQSMPLGQQDYLAGTLTAAVIQQERPRFVMLNLAEMDWPVAHINGGPADPRAVTTLMQNADRVIGLLVDTYRSLGLLDKTVFVVTSDHGTVVTSRLVDRNPLLTAVQKAGTQIVTADFHTAGFFWLEDGSRALQVATLFDAERIPGVSAVYYRTTQDPPAFQPSPDTARRIAPALDAAYRYLLATINGANAPHVVAVYPEQTGTVDAGGSVVWNGDHGGFSWQSHAVPLVMAGPGIRRGYVSRFPARTVDLTPTMLRLLGVPYPQLDGVSLADAFSHPLSSELILQKSVARYLVPITAVLQRQSKLET